MPLWTTWYVELFPPLVAASVLAAWRWGSTTQLVVAAAYVAATDLQKALEGLSAPMFEEFEPVVAVVDIALAIGLAVLAIRTPKIWLVVATALQFVVCFAHVARAFQPNMPPLVYAILMGSGGYPLLILLWTGIASSAMSKRKDLQLG